MKFEEAILALKDGKMIRRDIEAFNDWHWLIEDGDLRTYGINKDGGKSKDYAPRLMADDLLANDWEIVE